MRLFIMRNQQGSNPQVGLLHKEQGQYTEVLAWVFYPNVAFLSRGKTRKSASDAVARTLGQVEAYLTVH
jgi:hypothetical protein